MSDVVSGSQVSPVQPKKRTDVVLLLLLFASLSLNVYLGWQVRRAQPALNIPKNTFRLSPGTKVEPIKVSGPDGKELTISYDLSDKPTVFYVLSPSCIWCERNKANIEKLAETKRNDFRFIGLSLSEPGLQGYLEGHNLNFPVYTRLTSETIAAFGLGSTPQTIVVSPDGRVLKNWTGAYIERIQSEVESYFEIQLPGLTSGSR